MLDEGPVLPTCASWYSSSIFLLSVVPRISTPPPKLKFLRVAKASVGTGGPLLYQNDFIQSWRGGMVVPLY